MPTTLGLDLGTNSIGWALVENGKRIIDQGVRVFPIGVNEEEFNQGREISKNVARRIARGARRRRFRYKMRRESLLSLLEEKSMLPDSDELLTARQLYALRSRGLDEKLRLQEFGRILMILNKRRGFKSNRKTLASAEKKKEEGEVKEAISKLQAEIDQSKCRTVGEYFVLLFGKTEKVQNWHNRDEAIERIRARWVGREMYMHEFDLLWEKQASYYPDVLTPELRTIIRDKIIYYQRNLRSQKGLVGRCRFEPNKRCAPRSSFLFQEFRLWQQLSHIRITGGDRIGQALTKEEKQAAHSLFMKREYGIKQQRKLHGELKKLLGIPKNTEFNDIPITGNSTAARLIDALGEEVYDTLTERQRFELWHILLYTDNTEKLKDIVRRKIQQGLLPPLSFEAIDGYAEINLEEGYGNVSTKALNNILPYLRSGLEPFDAFNAAGYDPTRKAVNGKSVEVTKIPPLAPNELRNPIVQQMLSETFRVVNAIIKHHGKPDMIRVELARELKKPKKKREEARYQALRKRKQREEYAEFLSQRLEKKIEPNDPEVRKYELWLEMGCEDPELDDLDSFLNDGRITNAKKYKLWLECGRISPYSGNVIPLSKLFSPEIEIEHIMPYSKSMNNEFTNLCLCESTINHEKGDRLPFEYFASKGPLALEEFKSRVAAFRGMKHNRFLMKEIPEDFLKSQIANTSYAARELTARLEMLLPPIQEEDKPKLRVQVINGQATGILRRHWGLNAILSKGDIDTKNRGDHRHHAIDAIVIACTTPSLMHTLSAYSKFDALGRLRNERINQPWNGFLTAAEQAINSLIVSYRSQKRLIGRRPNRIKQTNLQRYPSGYFRQSTITIRGPLHEETNYGSIRLNGDEVFVTRWPLNKFTSVKQFEDVVDLKVREVLEKRVKKFAGDVKKALAYNQDDPSTWVYMYSQKGVKVPIKRVRKINRTEELIPVRDRVFVESGNNYCIAIYQDVETGKREFETISFWKAVQKALKKEPITPPMKNGKPLLLVLKQRDTVVTYEKHPDEIQWEDIDDLRKRIFWVRKMDVNGILRIDCIYTADPDEKRDANRLFFRKRVNTLKCVRVEVDVLGRIVRKEGL